MKNRMFTLATLVLLGVGAIAQMMTQEIPKNLNTASTRTSVKQQFKASYTSKISPIPIGKVHSWVLELKNSKGVPVDGATIQPTGSMPGHMHGMMTQPKVTKQLGQGKYLVEGMGFQMPGWWVMKFSIISKKITDVVEFNFVLSF